MKMNFTFIVAISIIFATTTVGQSNEVPLLGIHSNHVSKAKAQKLGFENRYGRYVTNVIGNTPAEKNGIQPFDYVIGLGEYELSENTSFHDAIAQYKIGEEVEIVYIRNGVQQSMTLVLGDKNEAVYKKSNKKEEAFFGIQQSHDKKTEQVNGVLVDIVNNSTAQMMGLKNGDVVQRINNYPMIDWHDISTAIDNMRAGEMITVTYYRDGNTYQDRMPIQTWNDTQIDGKTSLMDDDQDIEIDMNLDMITKKEAKDMEKDMGVKISIANNLQIDQLNLFPNPTNGVFNIRFELANQGETTIRVFDAAGRQVYTNNLGEYQGYFQDQIDISNNAKGVYFLEIRQGKNAMSRKIILN